MKKVIRIKTCIIALMIFTTTLISAQEDNQTKGDKKSADEIAKELADPNTVLGTLNFNFDYINYQGDLPEAGSQNSFSMGFQPVLPVPLNKTVNLFVRPNIPLYFTQPTFGVNGFENQGVNLGNISADVAVGKSFPSKTVGVLGVFGSFRTASNEDLRSPYTLLGPEIAVGQIFKWGVVGLLVSHGWSVNKYDDPTAGRVSIMGNDVFAASKAGESASITSGQYFYNISLKNGWQIAGGPTYSYNHKAEKGNKFTLPVGGGAVKVVRFGKLPMKFQLQYWYYVASPDAFGPQHQIRFTVSPVVALPW
ncbi:MAG: hypothetical protein KKD74_07665 [Bacteroidetes bacterium]|nr:hypothetical protein [Bacteroidota bacterium]